MNILTHKNTNTSYIDWFKTIAYDLMNYYSLKVGDAKYRFTELEFYYKYGQEDQKDGHYDEYVHGDDRQLTNGQWYFHGSGLDITFGNKETNAYGGILIRGIRDVKNDEYIDGSLKVVTEIFKQFKSIEKVENSLGLIKDKAESPEEPIRATRVGLNKKHDKDYYDKQYRFIIEINAKHQFKEKIKVAQQMKKDGYSVDDINKIFGYKIIPE